MTRLTSYAAVSTALSLLSDRELDDLVERAEPIGSGIGGEPLRPAHAHPLRRRVDLRVGLRRWRELAVHTMTTDWVLAGEHEGFPLMYQWRVLPHPGQVLPEKLDQAVDYWGPEVGPCIEVLRASTARWSNGRWRPGWSS
ncbi:hypothetical protein ACWGE0_02110 [Lentzea sp. NPDC054927]